MKKLLLSRFPLILAVAVLVFMLLPLSATLPAKAAGGACRTPDGFYYQATPQKVPVPQPGREKKDGKGIGGTGIQADRGIGGTGDKMADGKGIGGTGINLADGKGIGGTGVRFAEGIAVHGRITGFGSICVNGLEIRYPPSMAVKDGGGKTAVSDLKVGQIVSVVAHETAGQFNASSIALDRLLTGRLDRIDAVRSTLVIGGQAVKVGNIGAALKSLVPGQTLSVTGFRDARGHVVATYIDRNPAPANTPAGSEFGKAGYVAMQGYVTGVHGSRDITVGGAKVIIPDAALVTGGHRRDITENDRLIVFGRHEGGTVRADIVAIERQPLDAAVSDAHDMRDLPKGAAENRGHEGNDGGGNSHEGSDGHGDDHEERDNSGRDQDRVEKPEVEKPEVEKPEIEKPEIEKPEIEKPDIEPPEIEH